MKKPIVAVDIGNTTITIGIFRGKRLISQQRIQTQKSFSCVLWKRVVKKIKSARCENAIICSVVPLRTKSVQKYLGALIEGRVFVLGRDIKVPIENRYKKPKQVGQDRLVNAYAGLQLFGKGLIIVDFGTAITFDVVSRKGAYLGGLVFPGIEISLQALHIRTALLPKIKLTRPQVAIGRNTQESINAGMVFGFSEMIDGLIVRLRHNYKGYSVIATGGRAYFFKRYVKLIDHCEPQLTLQGLYLLVQKNLTV